MVCYTIFMMDLRKWKDKRICVAVSGGVDSIALLHYAKQRSEECGFSLSAVHCEHGIRGEESLSDMRFVQRICMDWRIPLYCFSENCVQKSVLEKTSLETAARDFRYACFQSILDENKADIIALAHHKDDEAETVLFRLARGTALSGIKGMTEENGCFVRPFLTWTRKQIVAYAQENGISYQEDSTNFQTDATRNKLRLEVLPRLEDAVEGAVENIARFALLAEEDDALLYEYAKSLIAEEKSGGYLLSFSEKRPLFSRACLWIMKKMGVEKDYTSKHIESVYDLQKAERGSKISLPKEIEAKKTEKGIEFYKKEEKINIVLPPEKKFDETGFDGGMYEVNVFFVPPALKNGYPVLRIDGDRLPKDAVFRFRREGDEISRFGGGRKTLKKVFNEKKFPVEERQYVPLIADADGEVYVICGVEISEKVKITENTKNPLYITLQKKEETKDAQ